MSRRARAMLAAAALVTASCVGGEVEPDPVETTAATTPATTTTSTQATTTTVVPIFPEISWTMPARFGLDGDGDGRIDVPNTAEYLRNIPPGSCAGGCPAGAPTFSVELDATGSRSEAGSIQEYRWEVRDGPEVVATVAETEPTVEIPLAEGSYVVSLTVIAGGGSATEHQAVEVRDHLIVALGDSYASGEGNPEASDRSGSEVVGIWADDGLPDGSPVHEGHRRAHRSTLAASPQAALDLEMADPRSSVSLLFLARSGAEIEAGMLGPQPGPTGAVSAPDLLPQIDAVAELLGCIPAPDGPRCDRSIDALTLTIGGNDIGFNVMIGGLVAADPALSFRAAYEFALDQLFGLTEAGIRDLDRLYEELDAAIRTRLQVDDIYLIAYPSAAGSGDGLCEVVADDLVPGLEADRDEILETVSRVIEPLREKMAAAAAAHGWTYVDGHLAAFAGHGYCGTEPYPATAYPGNPFPDPVEASSEPGVRWFRRARESVEIQGGGGRFEPADLATDGTLHPNELGHQAIKEALLALLDVG